jgi:hypothetical protein
MANDEPRPAQPIAMPDTAATWLPLLLGGSTLTLSALLLRRKR